MGKTNRAEEGVKLFKEGWSCSQAVLSVFSKDFGLEPEKAFKISQAFGGGMARTGETCGAVTGALMVVGLKYGRTRPKDEDAKEKTYSLVLDFFKTFKAHHGSLICRELIGTDMSTPDGHRKASESGVFETLCPKFVADAVEILERIL